MKSKWILIVLLAISVAAIFFQNATPLIEPTTGLTKKVCGPAPATTLKGQKLPLYNQKHIQNNWGKISNTGFKCEKIPSVPPFDPPEFYIKGTNNRNEKYPIHMAPWQNYEREINRLGDLYLSTGSQSVANCMMRWLNAWSSTRVLSKTTNYKVNYSAYSTSQGEYDRKMIPIALLTNYLKIKSLPLDKNHVENFRKWMASIMPPVQGFIARREMKDEDKNNHSYWAGALLMLYAEAFTGINSSEAKWAIGKYQMGIGAIQSNGVLVRELHRGSKAFIYHQYSMIPLVMMAEIGERHGLSMYDQKGSALSRLKVLILKGYKDEKLFERLSGVAQDDTPKSMLVSNTSYLSWMELWYSRFGDKSLRSLLATARVLGRSGDTYNFRRLGGDLTLAFGVSDCHLPLGSVNLNNFRSKDGSVDEVDEESYQPRGLFKVYGENAIFKSYGHNLYCHIDDANDSASFLEASIDASIPWRYDLPEAMGYTGQCSVTCERSSFDYAGVSYDMACGCGQLKAGYYPVNDRGTRGQSCAHRALGSTSVSCERKEFIYNGNLIERACGCLVGDGFWPTDTRGSNGKTCFDRIKRNVSSSDGQ